MSEQRGHKRNKSLSGKDIPSGTGDAREFESLKEQAGPLPQLSENLGVPEASGMSSLKRSASALTSLSEASSLEASNPIVRNWIDFIRDELYEYCMKRNNATEVSFKGQDRERFRKFGKGYVELEFPLIFYNQDLLKAYLDNPEQAQIKAPKAQQERKKFVEHVLLFGLDRCLNHPFNEEAVGRLLRNKHPHRDINVKDFTNESFFAAIEEFKKENYWTGIRILYPSLKRSGNAKAEEWWENARMNLAEGWNEKDSGFLDSEVITAVFARMTRGPGTSHGGGKLYAKFLHLIQAAGSGKSRLMKELVSHIPGVYINLSNSVYTLPSRDNVLLEWLNSKVDGMQTTMYVCLLDGLFMESFDQIDKINGANCHSEEDLAKKLQLRLDSSGDRGVSGATFFPDMTAPRDQFMQRVQERADKRYNELEREKHWNDDALKGPHSERHPEVHTLIMNKFIKPWALKLQSLKRYNLAPSERVSTLVERGKGFPAAFLFCIDELTQMEIGYDTRESSVDESPRHHLERAASLFHSLDVWFCAGSPFPYCDIKRHRYHASDRISSGTYILPRPFCAMPLHIEAIRQMETKDPESKKKFLNKPLIEFSDLSHLTLYGKPLWRTHRHLAEEDFNRILFTRLVRNYHSGTSTLDNWKVDLKNPCHVFSVVSVRAYLDPIVGSNTTMERLSDTVVKHLCPVKHLDPVLGVIQLDQYMDPPLANAVTDFFTRNPSNWSQLIEALANNLVEFPVRDLKGERGELFTRFICLISRDRAWEFQKKLAKKKELEAPVPDFEARTSKPILLSIFLKALLPTGSGARVSNWEHLKYLTLTDGNSSKADRTLEKIFKQAYINFTHFEAADQPLKTKSMPALLHNLLRQNAALISKPGQAAWDLLIPYYNGDPMQPFNRDNVSAIVIQVKNRGGSEPEFLADFQKIEDQTARKEKSLEDFQWYRYFTDLNLSASPLIAVLCEPKAGRYPGTKTGYVNVETIKNNDTILGLRMVGATKETYGCLDNDVPLQNAFNSLLGTSTNQFVDHSEYESRISANNILFENSKYCDYLSNEVE